MVSSLRPSSGPVSRPRLISTLSWILYDFANTAYSMNVVSLYFGTWMIIDLGQSDAVVSIANSLSMILVALTLPVLGDWSDWKGKKLVPLFVFTALCVTGTAVLGVLHDILTAGPVLVTAAIVIYMVANYSFQGGLVFYNALLPVVSTPRSLGRVSGYGVAMGYLGAIIGLVAAQAFVEGSVFGYHLPFLAAGGTEASFVPTAALFLFFAIPIFIFVRDPHIRHQAGSWTIAKSYRKVFKTLRDTRKHRGLLRFLVAKLLYEDAIQTVIIFMGVYTQEVMGFSRGEANTFFVVIIPSAVLGSALCGILTDHYGPHRTLMSVVLLWVIGLVAMILNHSEPVFWGLGAVLGALLGSTWTAARPLLVTLVPREMLGEFFGLYALSGKVAAITGPLLWSLTSWVTRPWGTDVQYKTAIAVLCGVMVIGLWVLRGVPDLHAQYKYASSPESDPTVSR